MATLRPLNLLRQWSIMAEVLGVIFVSSKIGASNTVMCQRWHKQLVFQYASLFEVFAQTTQ